MRIDDPWYDVQASGTGTEKAPPRPPVPVPGQQEAPSTQAAVYLTVQNSAVFAQLRRRHRRFVLPAVIALLAWYFGYLLAAAAAPGLMATPVVGAFNVGALAGLGQFVSAFLLTWGYARHARLRRDNLAFELRWQAQEMARVASREHRTTGSGAR